MADTVYTPDGRAHVLLGSTTPASIIREYAGGDVLRELLSEVSRLCHEINEIAEDSDMRTGDIGYLEIRTAALESIFK